MNYEKINDHISLSSFITETGCEELFISISTNSNHALFTDTLNELQNSFETAMSQINFRSEHLVFSRLYCSDIENQKNMIRASRIFPELLHGVLSVVEQPCLDGGGARLLLYCVKTRSGVGLQRTWLQPENEPWCNRMLFTGNHYRMLWIANYTGYGPFRSFEQTRRLFDNYAELLASQDMNLADHVHRTWLFVRDVDNHYQGMVDARREYFQQLGMKRFPASTGIEGKAREIDTLVTMDALAFSGLTSNQIVPMEARDHLSPTTDYNVTFERGMRLRFGDRSHFHISGTASIDTKGNVLHEGDVLKQTERTVENMNALLEGQGTSFHDLAYCIVYLRDSSVYKGVKERICRLMGESLPIIALRAPVCRPAWLIEMEGVAIAPDRFPAPVFL